MANFVTYPGLGGIRRCTYTCPNGFQPGVAVTVCRPQDITNTLGNLVLGDSQGGGLTLTNCLLDENSIRRSGRGTLMVVQIKDRRWRWQFGGSLGQINVSLPDKTIDPATALSARDIVSLLFSSDEGMGEPGVDVSVLPADDYPPIDWQGEKAWVACQRILRRYGCDVAFDLATDSFKIVKDGVGNDLPSTKVQSYGISSSFSPWPDNIAIWSGPTIAETMFELQYVAPDLDGTVLPIDELSYIPSGGWEPNLTDPYDLIPDAGKKAYGLANRCVGRWFQIKNVVGGGLELPGGIPMDSIQQALPLRNTRLATYTSGGEQYEAPARLEGVFATAADAPAVLTNTAAWTEYDGRFRINRELGIVMTTDPIWKLDGSGGYAQADLFLTTSHFIQNTTKNWLRYFRFQNIANNGVPTEQRVREQYQITVQGVYDEGSLVDTIDNEAAIADLMDLELAEWAAGYSVQTGQVATYGGIRPISPDGKIRAVQFDVDLHSGAHTYASANSEYLLGLKPRRTRDRDGEATIRDFFSPDRRKRQRGRGQ